MKHVEKEWKKVEEELDDCQSVAEIGEILERAVPGSIDFGLVQQVEAHQKLQEEKALIIFFFIGAFILFLFISVCNIPEPDSYSQLLQYQSEIEKLEQGNKIKADTEAARLKLKQLHEQRLKELEKDNG